MNLVNKNSCMVS